MNDRPSDRCGGGDGPEPVLTAEWNTGPFYTGAVPGR